jgi:hypothetical protein
LPNRLSSLRESVLQDASSPPEIVKDGCPSFSTSNTLVLNHRSNWQLTDAPLLAYFVGAGHASLVFPQVLALATQNQGSHQDKQDQSSEGSLEHGVVRKGLHDG